MSNLGRPRPNQTRSLNENEKKLLKTKLKNLIVSGTTKGFDVYDGGTGRYVDLTSEEKVKLLNFWGVPPTITMELLNA